MLRVMDIFHIHVWIIYFIIMSLLTGRVYLYSVPVSCEIVSLSTHHILLKNNALCLFNAMFICLNIFPLFFQCYFTFKWPKQITITKFIIDKYLFRDHSIFSLWKICLTLCISNLCIIFQDRTYCTNCGICNILSCQIPHSDNLQSLSQDDAIHIALISWTVILAWSWQIIT